MTKSLKLSPIRKYNIGYFINEQMEYRGWKSKYFESILGNHVNSLNAVLNHNFPLTPELAHSLSKAFGTSPEYWLNLDINYRKWLLSKTEK